MWLPQIAEVYRELRGKRLHRRISFSNYLQFGVDDKQQIAALKPNPNLLSRDVSWRALPKEGARYMAKQNQQRSNHYS